MDRIMDVAAYITTRYQKISNKEIDEMMLYKLLYLVQRDSLAIMGVPAFQEELVVWNNGPISRDVRANYCEGEIICPTEEPSDSVTTSFLISIWPAVQSEFSLDRFVCRLLLRQRQPYSTETGRHPEGC